MRRPSQPRRAESKASDPATEAPGTCQRLFAWRTCEGRARGVPARLLGAALALALVTAPSCKERTVVSEHYGLGPAPLPGNPRTVVQDESGIPERKPEASVTPILRMRFDGHTLPIASPDGLRVALQTATNASWAVEVGDPLPPTGLTTRIEAITLQAESPGAPLSTVEGPWLLGRGASDQEFLLERPRADGARDLALARWTGGERIIAQDEWTNAFATIAPDGALAWSRRPAEGGDWQLVVQRGGERRVLAGKPGESWLLPVFSGDGTGIFALRLDPPSMVVAWIPFGPGRVPPPDALERVELVALLSLRANLTTAVQSLLPVTGLSASSPGRERLAIYLPESGRMALWAPGGRLEPLAPRSVSATLVDVQNALVTLPEMVARQRLGPNELPARMLAEGAWVTRPIVGAATEFLAFRANKGQIEIARLALDPDAAIVPPTQ